MTRAAIRRGRNVIDWLTGGSGAVMAGGASAQHLRVINLRSRFPDTGGMTRLADIAGLNVRCILAGSVHAVVTSRATAGYTRVIKARRTPSQGAMTGAAFAARVHMGGCFASGYRTVVTRRTGADDLRMIHLHDRLPRGRGMTGLAGIAAGDMPDVLAGRLIAVMT